MARNLTISEKFERLNGLVESGIIVFGRENIKDEDAENFVCLGDCKSERGREFLDVLLGG